MYHTLPQGNSWYGFFPDIPPELHMNQDTFTRIWNLHPEEKGVFKMMGKEIPTPRWQQAFGHDYRVSRTDHTAVPLTDPFLIGIMNWVRERHPEMNFNGLLVNWYLDGHHHIGYHADATTPLVVGSPIYSFSYGATRNFKIKADGEPSINVPVTHN